jgi:hypothetical protein
VKSYGATTELDIPPGTGIFSKPEEEEKEFTTKAQSSHEEHKEGKSFGQDNRMNKMVKFNPALSCYPVELLLLYSL